MHAPSSGIAAVVLVGFCEPSICEDPRQEIDAKTEDQNAYGKLRDQARPKGPEWALISGRKKAPHQKQGALSG